MSRKRMSYLLVIAAAIAIGYLGWKLTARTAYESAEYTVLEVDSPFEIREYPDLVLVTTRMNFESQGDDGSFMRLFRYISGANEDDQKVAMTTPVFMGSNGRDDLGQMGFVLPQEVASQHVPKPSHEDVTIEERSRGKFAAIRFAGRMNPESAAEAEEKLRQWMANRDLVGIGEAESAGYDPPWTPGPFRRNEVLIRLK